MKIIERLFELQELELGPKAGLPETQQAGAAIRKEIPEPILGHYDRLMQRGKKGVALVRNGVCSGCQMKLASGTYASLLRDEDLGVCDTCGRYFLLVPEPPAPAPAPPKPKAPRGRPKKVPVTA